MRSPKPPPGRRREPLRQEIADQLPMGKTYAGKAVPIFPSVGQEMALIQKEGNPQVFAIPDLPEYRCLASTRPWW
jgi:hypothetical protein